VQIHGNAEIIEQPAAMDMLIFWYKQVRGEHKNWDDTKSRWLTKSASSSESTSRRSARKP